MRMLVVSGKAGVLMALDCFWHQLNLAHTSIFKCVILEILYLMRG